MPESPKLAKTVKSTDSASSLTSTHAEVEVHPRSPHAPIIVLSPSEQSEKDKDPPFPTSSTSETLQPISSFTPPTDPTPVSGDLIIPLMIYAVVKSNPSHLVSHLLYAQRFRNQRFGGEESYCLVNLLAVADFLENVDLRVLGLGDGEEAGVQSIAQLSPIPVTQAALADAQAEGVHKRLRRGVEQQVDAIAGSANKVLAGVVDSSFGVLRSLLPGQAADDSAVGDGDGSVPWNARPGFGLLRRESGFSIASLAASLPGRDRGRSVGSATAPRHDEGGQMMVEVSSRPGSVHSAYMSDDAASESERDEDDEDEDDDDDGDDDEKGDGRSIRSFESMMKKGRKKRDISSRKSLSDRLASMPGLSRLAGQQQANMSAPQPITVSYLHPMCILRVG
jgi:hypothetical protein